MNHVSVLEWNFPRSPHRDLTCNFWNYLVVRDFVEVLLGKTLMLPRGVFMGLFSVLIEEYRKYCYIIRNIEVSQQSHMTMGDCLTLLGFLVSLFKNLRTCTNRRLRTTY